jgi:flagella basal body P-ring formation protein FlgA
MRIRPITFKRDISQYLADCSEVANKILAKELREDDILQIVREFNQACGK